MWTTHAVSLRGKRTVAAPYPEEAKQLEEAATCSIRIMRFTDVIISKQNEKETKFVKSPRIVLLVAPSGGCAPVTSIINANCVHRQSIVSTTKKPDSKEPCHGEL